MNYIDYIVIILIVISAISGAVKGFVYEVSSLIGLIVGVWGAIKFSGALETYLVQRWDVNVKHIDVIAFVIVFVVILILVHLLAKAIEKAIEMAELSVVNRVLGFIFSIFKSMFILGILMILIETLHQSMPFLPVKDVNESKYSQPLKVVAIKTFPFLQELFGDNKKTN